MNKEKKIAEENKIAAEESAVSEKPIKKRSRKRAKIVNEFLKKQSASGVAAPAGTFQPVSGEEKIVDKREAEVATEAGSENRARKKKILKIFLSVLVSLLFLGLLGSAGYFYFQYKNVSKANSSNQEIKNYIAKIGKFILLPDESPTVATVADKDKLSGQPFFANAQNGDKVLLFSKAQKAILYRPGENKIIEVMSLSVAQTGALENNQASQPSEPPAQAEAPASSAPAEGQVPATPPDENQPVESQLQAARVAVYNGARISGLAQKIADPIALMSEVTVSEKTNAEGKYPKTIVIDLSGSRQELAQKIADTLGGEIGVMPDGETKPDADILIIGGSDFKAN